MKILIVLFGAVACSLATPQFPLYPQALNYPFYPGYQALGNDPIVRSGLSGYAYAPGYNVGVKNQYHYQDALGQVRHGHVEPGQSHHEVQDAFGNKIGGYSYYNPEGKLVQTSYIADIGGFRVASNDLPVAPVAPIAPVHAVQPQLLLDTPEVAAAKAAHLAAHEIVKNRNRRQVPLIYPVTGIPAAYRYAYPPAYPTTNTLPQVKADGHLEDTPEVNVAKANHFAHVAAARYNHYASAAVRTPYYYPFVAFK